MLGWRLLLPALAAAGASAAEAPAPDNGALCLDPPYLADGRPGAEALAALLARTAALIAGFPSLAAALGDGGPRLCLVPGPSDAHGTLDVEAGVLAVSADLPPDAQAIVMVHELRHLEQSLRGFCPSNEIAMEENARAVYAMEADAQAITALVAWAAREDGDEGPWDALAALSDYADVPSRLEDEMRAGGDVGAAVSAAFAQWYAEPARIDRYHRASCLDYLDRQDATKRLPSYALLDPAFYDSLCRLPDGTPYTCLPPEAPR